MIPNYTQNNTRNYTPGFSTRIHDPEIKAALKKNRMISRIFLLILSPVPIIGAAIYALVTGEMELGQAIIGGAVVSGIILVINFLIGMSHSAKNSYEAVVIDKKCEYDHKTNDSTAKRIRIQNDCPYHRGSQKSHSGNEPYSEIRL